MLWIALAAQLSMPTPIDVFRVFSPEDMPTKVQIAGINRFVPTRTTIGPDGKAQSCGWDHSSGDGDLDRLSCAIILKRAKFKPATWLDGSAAYAVLYASVTWTIGGSASDKELRRAYPPDAEVTVSQMPSGVHSPTSVQVMIAVDENGHVAGCQELTWSFKGRGPVQPAELVRIACDQMKDYRAIPPKDPTGKPARSVQNAIVSFSTKP